MGHMQLLSLCSFDSFLYRDNWLLLGFVVCWCSIYLNVHDEVWWDFFGVIRLIPCEGRKLWHFRDYVVYRELQFSEIPVRLEWSVFLGLQRFW